MVLPDDQATPPDVRSACGRHEPHGFLVCSSGCVHCNDRNVQLIHHSDAGSQYTSIRLTDHLALEEIAPSIGTVGDAYDNALMETINGVYKAECIRTTVFHQGPFKTPRTSSSRPPAGSTGTTPADSTVASACSAPSNSRQTTARPSTESRNPHNSGTKPKTVQNQALSRTEQLTQNLCA